MRSSSNLAKIFFLGIVIFTISWGWIVLLPSEFPTEKTFVAPLIRNQPLEEPYYYDLYDVEKYQQNWDDDEDSDTGELDLRGGSVCIYF